MKKLILAFIVVLALNIKAQTNVYQPWPSDSSLWLLEYYPNISSLNPTEYWNATLWLGDTVINTKTYTKTYIYNGFPLGTTLSSYTYTGGVRQDIPNEKLYQIGTSGSEYEVFNNQHLAVGDTFPCFTGNGILTNIDSVLIQGKYHKRYNDTLNSGGGSISKLYIVGVGPVLDQSDSYYYAIDCYLLDTNSNYPYCQIPASAGIQKLSKQNAGFSVSPNPSSGAISIAGNIIIDELKVTDMLGQTVYEAKPNTTNTTLTLNDVGVYFITLTSGTETSIKKVIVSK